MQLFPKRTTAVGSGYALLLISLLLLVPAMAVAEEEVLGLEDVVRGFVSGRSTPDLIRWIQSSQVDFDLSEEMLDELKLAGVPAGLIETMVERQNELHGAPPEPEGTAPVAEAAAQLRIRLEPTPEGKKEKARPVLKIPDGISPEVADQLRLTPEQSRFTDVAVFLACRTPDHVPDHWRSASPLGRDFNGVPRHRMLAFLPGAEWKESGKVGKLADKLSRVPGQRGDGSPPGVLSYTLPELIEVELEPDVEHDLTLGIALQAGTRFYLITQDPFDRARLTKEDLEITARLDHGSSVVPRLKFVKPKP